jgi:diguanylate cyclase (GGDEF)-like protein
MSTILIIEDEYQIRENIQQILDLEGFSTITAENGLLGLQMVEEHHPDMIICDLMMPHLDGYGLIKELRQRPATADIPFIFLTAKAEYRDLRKGMALGADDYLTKPFQVHELLEAILTRLEKREVVTKRYKGEIERMEAEINYLARHDNLTNLPNQLFLEEYFNKTRLQVYNNGQCLPLLLIDIDIHRQAKLLFEPGLKQSLIKVVAERLNELNSNLQVIDFIAYLKTDKLAIFLKPVQNPQLAAGIAEEILNSLSKSLRINNQEISIQAKISIAAYPLDGLQLNELLTHAEITLEHYKLEDANSYYFYEQEILNVVFRKVILESDFLPALERNEFQLYYQPQVNTKTGKVVGLEALIRWQHPEYGIVSPAEFIPLAEESGFIIPLGEWIIKTACLDLKKLSDQGFDDLKVAVNISAHQFRQENLVQRINEIIQQTNLNPELLELELTETVFIQDIELVKRKVNLLGQLGIKISIDDFGTGYSSFKYLQEFSFSHLKIDRYFINNIDKLNNKQSIVSSIIQLAQHLHIDIIAEGVETNEELNWLRQNSCYMIQGYLFSRPLTLEELNIFLMANN